MLTWCQWGWRKPHLLHELFSVDSMMIRTWWWEWGIRDYVASRCIESWQCGLQWRETRRIWHFTKGNRHCIASRALCAWPISTSRVNRHSRRIEFRKLKYDLIKWLKILLHGLVIFRHSQLPGSWPWADSVISHGTTSYRWCANVISWRALLPSSE